MCRPRGRPRGFCLDAAVETALRLFRERGYDAVGVAELAQAIGVAPPSLYAAFGSKAGLYARALDLYQQREGAFLAEALRAKGGARDILAILFVRAAEAFARDPQGCLICRGEQGCHDPAAASLTVGRRRAARDLIEARLQEAGAADPALLADYALAALQGLSGAAGDGVNAARLRRIAVAWAEGAPA